MSDFTIYEVRGNFPDLTLRYFTAEGKADKCVKERPDCRVKSPITFTPTKLGVCELLTRQFEFIDDGIREGTVDPDDRKQVDVLRERLADAERQLETLRAEEHPEDTDDL